MTPNQTAYLDRVKAERRAMLDQFADALSRNGNVAAACRVVGCTLEAGKRYLRTLRAELGWQAS